MTISTKYLGLDVHRDTISIAVADEGRDREIRFFGTIANDGDALLRASVNIGKARS
ncbi:hypothetical protein [Mesorhizobium retamae]|uniref:IS110 family transposase n=1 Tax=Mesorhizobium retamae TaxID=2912854 RepID=A0ABS9QPI4_9HYPH|nr:hypothetical protein [Mesorhizobium sp. IRAMC:0171]MCG7509367.1 hypothetical protein [Mesorhizobium sp. IRAMC:0171]